MSEEAEKESTSGSLRQHLREETRIIRRNKRQELHTGRRQGVEVEEEKINPQLVRDLALSLRKRGATDLRVLAKLQSGLLEGPEHISAFMSTDGALIALIKYLTGLNPAFELKAAYCICNLALAGGKTAMKLAKSAAPYLLVHLDGMNPLMQDACSWALGNIAAGGEQAFSQLYTLGAFPKLLKLFSSPHPDVVTSAAYSVTLFVSAGFKQLSQEEFQAVATAVCPLLSSRPSDLCYLTFLLSCSSHCDLTFSAHSIPTWSVLELSNLVLNPDFVFTVLQNMRTVTYLLRTLGNLSSDPHVAHTVIDTIQNSQSSVLKILLNSSFPHIVLETQWFVTNLYKNDENRVREILGF